MEPNKINPKDAIDFIRKDFKAYVEKNGMKAIVLGLSGGVDSALVAAILGPVCKELNIKFIGASLPSESNKSDEITRAEECGTMCTDFKTISINPYYTPFLRLAEIRNEPTDAFAVKVRKGNIKARTRMIILYDLAHKYQGMVISTDNLTELYLGFWTLHGDVGDYAPIQNLWKTDVYRMAKYLVETELKDTRQGKALQLCIDAVPTDGLGITKSDLDQIGTTTYQETDQILFNWIIRSQGDEKHPVIQRYKRTAFKRTNPYNVGF